MFHIFIGNCKIKNLNNIYSSDVSDVICQNQAFVSEIISDL